MQSGKKALDRKTLNKRLEIEKIAPECALVLHSETNSLEKDGTGRNLLKGNLIRSYLICSYEKIKGTSLHIDYRPIFDIYADISFYIVAKIIRNGLCVDKKVMKRTVKCKVRANNVNKALFNLTDKITLNKNSLTENDLLEINVTIKQKDLHPEKDVKHKPRIYLSNMYITKEK